MNLSTGVSVGQLILAFGTMLAVSGVAWGGLLQRVKTLEREVKALSNFSDLLIRIDERVLNIKHDVDAIKRSPLIREPPPYAAVSRPTP